MKCDVIKALEPALDRGAGNAIREAFISDDIYRVKRCVELPGFNRPKRRAVEIDERGAHGQRWIDRLQGRAIDGELSDMGGRRQRRGGAQFEVNDQCRGLGY